ncbi:hypothetical protein SDC9_155526 [bioreactor metagenome]|uniref:Uncharacterized protein n=1 Tax=bioreactor metagenome TaxID=1076179 RepID=A0A645F6K6_9ZZZZ
MTENQIVSLIADEINKKAKECMSMHNRDSVEFISVYSSMLVLNEILFKINLINVKEKTISPIKIEYEQSE